MKIVKIPSNEIREFETHNNYINISINQDCNYYLVNDPKTYEVVESMPDIGGIVDGSYESVIKYAVLMSNEVLSNQVMVLEGKLAESDYKIIKMYEYNLVGMSTDYDINELHLERQTLRSQINELRSKIKPEKTWDELSDIITYNHEIGEEEVDV